MHGIEWRSSLDSLSWGRRGRHRCGAKRIRRAKGSDEPKGSGKAVLAAVVVVAVVIGEDEDAAVTTVPKISTRNAPPPPETGGTDGLRGYIIIFDLLPYTIK